MKIIGLCGYSKSGKDFVAKQILENIKQGCSYALANPLKQMLADTLGVSVEWIEKNKDEVVFEGRTVRRMLIDMSEKAIKKHVPEFWCRALDREIIRKQAEGYRYMIVTDIRYLIEVGYLRQLRGNHNIMFVEIQACPDHNVNKNCGYELAGLQLNEKMTAKNHLTDEYEEGHFYSKWMNYPEHIGLIEALKAWIR